MSTKYSQYSQLGLNSCGPRVETISNWNQPMNVRLEKQIEELEERLAKMRQLKETMEKNPAIMLAIDLMREVGVG